MSASRSDLPARLVVAAGLIALAFAALWLGGIGFWLVLCVAGILMMGEWAGLAGATPQEQRLAQYAISVPLAASVPGLGTGQTVVMVGFLALGLVAGAFFFLAAVTRRLQLAAGVFYVGLPVLALLLLRSHPDGFRITFWTMAVVWACDSGAYFAGRAIGGPRLWPQISPNKTWSGAIGGILAAVAFTIAFALLNPQMGTGMAMIFLSPWLAVLAQAGDLFESHLKRVAGVKDSGNVLPGHGGLMDRLDGLVPVAPVAAVVIVSHYVSMTGGRFWL